jgi:hypothetical protein
VDRGPHETAVEFVPPWAQAGVNSS